MNGGGHKGRPKTLQTPRYLIGKNSSLDDNEKPHELGHDHDIDRSGKNIICTAAKGDEEIKLLTTLLFRTTLCCRTRNLSDNEDAIVTLTSSPLLKLEAEKIQSLRIDSSPENQRRSARIKKKTHLELEMCVKTTGCKMLNPRTHVKTITKRCDQQIQDVYNAVYSRRDSCMRASSNDTRTTPTSDNPD